MEWRDSCVGSIAISTPEVTMKITPKSHIPSNKRTQAKKNEHSSFGAMFSSELSPTEQQTSHADTADYAFHNQQAYPLLEQASQLLSQALTQLEDDAQPHQETLHAIHEIQQELEQLTAQGAESKALSQAKTLLAVEAQRIQTMKH